MDKAELAPFKERLYIIRWHFEHLNPENAEDRVETFSWEQRQKAFVRYLALQEQWYASEIRFQVAQPQDIDMDKLLNSF